MPEQHRPHDEHEPHDSNLFPSDLLAQRLDMIQDFVEQSCVNYEQHPAQSQRMLLVFTAVLAGLTQDLQLLLTPELLHRAQEEVAAAAERTGTQLTEEGRESAARLLAGIWGTGATEGVTTQIWQNAAPGLPDACIQAARLTGTYTRWNQSNRPDS
ncbi:hypothetical protein [Streptomyces minutiscleroticus]|uniref:hypothetical protein n=1 Tax=Streptomyces minutiscleroticus TaxID=68238 RepID=UPI00331ADE2F